MEERKKLEELGWLKQNEIPILKRFKYKSIAENLSPHVDENNVATRDKIFQDLITARIPKRENSDILYFSLPSEDILLAEYDRYGLPLRTVINPNTGLIRADPYYDESWLTEFYSIHYRQLYSNHLSISHVSFLNNQIKKGEEYLTKIKDRLNRGGRILEIGCGMGGILIPFKLSGFDVKGIDLGPEFVKLGNMFNLNLEVADTETLISRGEKYDLIILSHLIEHVPGINNLLSKVKNLLNEAGKVFIVVPGIFSVSSTYQNNFLLYLQNAHCWSFTKNTLSACLVQNGFAIEIIDDRIYCLAGLGASENVNLSGECESIILYLQQCEKNLMMRQFLGKRPIVNRLYNFTKRIYDKL